jgi:hypothetical protein
MQVHKFHKSKFITVHNPMQVHKFHTSMLITVSRKLIEDDSFHKFLLRAHLWMSDIAGRRSTAGGWRWIPDRGDGNGKAWLEEMEMLGMPAAPCSLATRVCSKDYKKSHVEHLTITGTGTLRNTPCHEKQSRIYHETSQHTIGTIYNMSYNISRDRGNIK